MKKTLPSLGFILVGVILWWALSNSAKLSIKRWDAKFDSVLRTTLSGVGLHDADIVASVNEIESDNRGQYVRRHLSLRALDKNRRRQLADSLEQAGADVHEQILPDRVVLLVSRGPRVYQRIDFLNPAPASAKVHSLR